MIVVCPRCSFGFESLSGDDYTCGNPDCGHVWSPESRTIVFSLTAEGRRPCPELRGIQGELVGRSFPVSKGRTVIGRNPDTEIRLTNLAVSREHAAVYNLDGVCSIEDLGSRTGVMVNRKKVTRAVLEIDDEVLIAGNVFEFRVRYEADMLALPVAEDGARQEVAIFQDGHKTRRIELKGNRLTVGRIDGRDVVIPHPMISRRHAVLRHADGEWWVMDAKSVTGTFVNGKPVIQAILAKGDRVQFGPVAFEFDGRALAYHPAFESLAISATAVGRTVESGLEILRDVSLSIQPGKLVGLIGPSGSGKTTLLNALSHFAPATSGKVLFNGLDVRQHHDILRHRIGYVPQDDIVHAELTPSQALAYAGRLRLPRDTTPEELQLLVHETLVLLGLDERADVPIRNLSGGQRKRVNVGVELLNRCNALFLDEPTSGLDPGAESRLMRLFRRLADQGRTVVVSTHIMENVDLLDYVAILLDGRLVFYGTPAQARKHFEIQRATDLYERLEEEPAEEWVRRFRADDSVNVEPASTTAHPVVDSREGSRRRGIGNMALQLGVLVHRYGRVMLSDRRQLALLFAQPVVIFLMICLVFWVPWQVQFMSAVAMFWVGCTNAAREIVRERGVWRRERMVGLRVLPYMLSKVLVIGGICVPQALIATFFYKFLVGFYRGSFGLDGPFGFVFVAMLAAAWSGMALGLVVSAFVKKAEHADAIVPIALIPQIIFAGVIEKVDSMNLPSRLISIGTSTRWTCDALNLSWRGESFDQFWLYNVVVMGFSVLLLAVTAGWLARVPRD